MRRALFLAFLLLTGTASAQETRKATYVANYDLDDTSYTYCVTTGEFGGYFDRNISGVGRVETSGSSTTVTGVTGSLDSFGPPAVGDIVFFKKTDGTQLIRYILTNADADTITVNSAVDLTGGVAWEWRKVTCGTAATNGWIDVAGFPWKKISLEITQLVATGGVDFKFECRDNTLTSTVHQVYPGETDACGTNATLSSGVCNVATGTTGTWDLIFDSSEQWDACRVGIKIGSADDGNDLTTNLEVINIYLVVGTPR